MIEPFKYRTPRRQQLSVPPSFRVSKEREVLAGHIDGVSASEPEERLANASRRYANFRFRMSLNGVQGQTGWKELDFLFLSQGSIIAVEVDDTTFIHRGENPDQDPDDLIRMEGLKELGVNVDKIHHIDAQKLSTQEVAERTARELFT